MVYQAMDTIEGIRVALKVPHPQLVNDDVLRDFRNEVRLTARLEHPHILPLKDASFIEDHFVIVFRLGERTLEDRLRQRMSLETALNYAEQLLDALAFAHQNRIIHCDVTPGNVILFPDHQLRLADFGIAKVAQRTIKGSGSGTVGFMAPEQAMGRPSAKSDVFSAGLIVYRMLSGHWPEYPYNWPAPGYANLKRKAHPDLIRLVRRAIDPSPKKRFRDGGHMLNAFRRIRGAAIRFGKNRRSKTRLRRAA